MQWGAEKPPAAFPKKREKRKKNASEALQKRKRLWYTLYRGALPTPSGAGQAPAITETGDTDINNTLQKARDFERSYLPQLSPEDQPSFHLTGGVGWINDPNGFSVYRGEYHLFFQYYPYDVKWGPMHWGHAKTRDFIHWERLPCALAPDMPYDKDG